MVWRAPWLRHRQALMALAAWDAACIYISYNLIYLVRLEKWEGVSIGLLVIITAWSGASYLLGRYSPPADRDADNWSTQAGKTLLAGSAVVLIFISHSWLYQIVDAQTRFRGFLIPFVITTCLLSTAGQTLRARLSKQKRQWFLIGNDVEKKTVSKELETERRELQLSTVFTSTSEISVQRRGAKLQTGIAVGSTVDNSGVETEKLLRLREKGERVIPLLNWCEQELQRIPPELVHSEWLIQADGFRVRPGSLSWRLKRLGDVCGAVVLIILTAPLLAAGAVLVWMEDRGPILYQQVRSGLYGKPVRIWKLRSMRTNAEQTGAQWASRGDPRITRIGRVIRATRVDELPQLFSVLNGDLSLIGPRPERPEIEEELERVIPNYRIRHWIRPGLSGWAQVCYPYGASIADSRMKLSYDLYYLRNASLPLDILITMKTVKLLAGAKGAAPKA